MKTLHDPYAFEPYVSDFDRYLLAEGRHWHSYEKMGAQLREVDGVTGVNFAVWAPNAETVSLVTLATPSRYVSHGLRYGLDNWRESGWHWESFGQMTPIKNVDLWQRIDQALSIHRVEHKHLRGDASHARVAAPHLQPARKQRMVARAEKMRLEAARPTLWESMLRSASGLVSPWREYAASNALVSPQGR